MPYAERNEGGKRTQRRDRVARRFAALGAVTALLIGLAPAIVGLTPVRNWVLGMVLPAEAGALSAREASLGWFSPVELRGVTLRGPAGRPLLLADRIRVSRPLWRLAIDRTELGQVSIDKPVAFITARPDGSNIEDLIAAFAAGLQRDQPPGDGAAGPATHAEIVVRGGSVAVTDTATDVTMIHDPIDGRLSLSGGPPAVDVSVSVGAAVTGPGLPLPALPLAEARTRRGGRLRVRLSAIGGGLLEASIEADDVELQAATPLLRRWDPGVDLRGLLRGGGALRWAAATPAGGGPLPDATSEGRLTVARLRLLAPSLTAGALTAAEIDAPWRLRSDAAGRLTIEQLDLASDFANVLATGALTAAELERLGRGDWRAARQARVVADIDLAGLARAAPELLSLQRGVTLDAGRVRIGATLSPQAGGQRVVVSLDTSDLVARRSNRPLRWEHPVSIELRGAASEGRVRIERLACQSAFLTVSARGEPEDFSAEAQLDLDELAARAGQLFDFGEWRLAGRAGVSTRFRRIGGDAFHGSVRGGFSRCVITHGGRSIVAEQELSFEGGADGALEPDTLLPRAIASAHLTIRGGDESDLVALRLDGADPENPTVEATARGGVAAWLRRFRLLAPAGARGSAVGDGLVASGRLDAKAKGAVTTRGAELPEVRLTLTDLRLHSPGLRIDEPRVTLIGDLAWDAARSAVRSASGELVASAAAMRSRNLYWSAEAAGGEVAIRADLSRLSGAAPGLLGSKRLRGELTGGVRLINSREARIDLVAAPLTILDVTHPQMAPLWSEPQFKVRGTLRHDPTADRLEIGGLTARVGALSAAMRGELTGFRSAMGADLTGEIDYDLAALQTLLARYVGPGVRVAGRRRAAVRLQTAAGVAPDAVWSRRLTGRLEAPWTGASLFGLPVGPGRLVASLGGGQLRAAPLLFSVGEGRASLTPIVQWDPPPAAWGLAAGPLLEDVRISREVSQQMLKFIAPVLADATRVEGEFSLRTDGVRAPLGAPDQVRAIGQLTIRDLRVTPGPATSQWVSAARTVEALAKDRNPAALAARPAPTLLSIDARTVDFRVAERRVHHRGLQFLVDTVPVSSAGSVGFDETLAITLSVPIQDRWISGDARLVGLRGQVLRLPVTGTLQRPRIDRTQLQAFSQQLIRSGLRGAVESEIGRALEKLFN